MRDNDISEYKVGDIIESMSGQYEVIDIKFKVNSKRERYAEYSICKWLDTGKDVHVTWNKGCKFKLIKRANENNKS
jgi:hypothetical protein